jgi:hypothetical protein
MKKSILILLISSTLAGCAISGIYDVRLKEVYRNTATLNLGETRANSFKENNVTKYLFEDDLIKIVWLPLSDCFSFLIENKSEETIKIIWDEAVYIDTGEMCSRVIHSGIKYNDSNYPQVPTVISKKAKYQDAVFPTDKIYYIDLGKYTYHFGGWRNSPLFPNMAWSKKEIYYLSQRYIGKTVKMLLPIQIQNITAEYIFYFTINDFILLQKQKEEKEREWYNNL